VFLQEPITACTLLLKLENQYKDVAKGSIMMPVNRIYHYNRMPDSMQWVQVTMALLFYEDLYPPSRPADAESKLNAGQLRNHILLWPKAIIWLNTNSRLAASQDKVTPPVALVLPSQGKLTAPSVSAASQQRVTPAPADDPLEPDHALDIE
jgi:hypothetical protein